MPSQQQASTTPNTQRDEWETPEYLARYISKMYQPWSDLAATERNAKFAWLGEGDMLDASWHEVGGHVGFCNPPYSNTSAWVEKAAQEALAGFTTVLLIPTPNGDSRDALLFTAAAELVYIVGRVAFVRPNGEPVQGNTRGSCIAVFRGYDSGPPRVRWVRRDDLIRRFG